MGKKQVVSSKKQEEVHLTVGAGEIWDDVVRYSVTQNLWGIENLSLIPGTAGAAPVQNIGAYGVELSDVFYSLRAYDMVEKKFVELSRNDCQFGYRDSLFKQQKGRYGIVSVTLQLSTGQSPVCTYKPLGALLDKKDLSVKDVRDLVVETRMSKLPDWKVYPNAGSFFKNVVITSHQVESLKVKGLEIPIHEVEGGYKVPTAWLIECVAEMKGARTRDVGTWPLQPLVLVNYGDATAQELIDFSQTIIDIIKEKTGIVLEREVQVVV
jgi:UDP-N-acetylmuramate dehydrogenase